MLINKYKVKDKNTSKAHEKVRIVGVEGGGQWGGVIHTVESSRSFVRSDRCDVSRRGSSPWSCFHPLTDTE